MILTCRVFEHALSYIAVCFAFISPWFFHIAVFLVVPNWLGLHWSLRWTEIRAPPRNQSLLLMVNQVTECEPNVNRSNTSLAASRKYWCVRLSSFFYNQGRDLGITYFTYFLFWYFHWCLTQTQSARTWKFVVSLKGSLALAGANGNV